MLDNFGPSHLRSGRRNQAGREPEVSGGVNLEKRTAYAMPGVDFVSIGARQRAGARHEPRSRRGGPEMKKRTGKDATRPPQGRRILHGCSISARRSVSRRRIVLHDSVGSTNAAAMAAADEGAGGGTLFIAEERDPPGREGRDARGQARKEGASPSRCSSDRRGERKGSPRFVALAVARSLRRFSRGRRRQMADDIC